MAELKNGDHILFHYGLAKENLQEAFVTEKQDEFVQLKIMKGDGTFYFKWYNINSSFNVDKFLRPQLL